MLRSVTLGDDSLPVIRSDSEKIRELIFKNASAFLPRRAGCEAPSSLRGCDPPEAFILHREIVLTMKASITLRAYLTTEVASIAR